MKHDDPPPPDPTLPAVGTNIYVPTQWFLSHGHDDFAGGKVKVKRVYPNFGHWTIEVEERPNHGYYWDAIRDEQEELKAEYGDRRGHPDPDDSPDSNSWR